MKRYLLTLIITISCICTLAGMSKEEYEYFIGEFEEVNLLNIENVIDQCRAALRKNKVAKIKKILAKAAYQNRSSNTAIMDRDNLLTTASNSNYERGLNLNETDQRRLAATLYQQLQQQTAKHQQTASCWSRHITTRTITGILSFAVTAGGYYGTYSHQCSSSDAPWYCDLLKAASASLSAIAGVYQFGHHINHTDTKNGLHEALALELQLTNLLRDYGISDTILNNLRMTSNAEAALLENA